MFMKYFPMVFIFAACSNENSDVVGAGGNHAGGGNGGGLVIPMGGRGSGGSAGNAGTSVDPSGELTIVVRDFKFYDANDPTHTNADFENVPATDDKGNPVAADTYWGPWDDKDIVTDTLGSDHKPVYKNTPSPLTTHGQAAFEQWYNTVDGINIMQEIPMTLTKNANGTYSYDSRSAGSPLSPGGGFFPIDDGSKYATSFGNQGKSHNYSFTVEIHTVFTYNGGETFHFSGDDDVFVYINNRLVINLGGIHSREPYDLSMDSLTVYGTQEAIPLTKDQTYPLDFFYAERHVVDSNLLITTSLGLSTNSDIPIK